MHSAIKLMVVCLSAILLGAVAHGQTASSPYAEKEAEKEADEKASQVLGIWASKGTIFSITRNDKELHGEVIAMKKPRPDRKNPDPKLRDRLVIGLQLLRDYRLKRGVWRGKLYDPGSGGTYSSYLKLDGDGNLRLRAYLGFALLGKTEVFQPVGVCSERIIKMLTLAGIENLC
jgi:uncharacterized protein (DUF2147 family)